MLVSFLRCFPNVETLHIESVCSAMISRPAAKQHVKFWQEVRPVECIKSHLKKIVVHGFGGKELEFEFLKFIRRRSQELLALLLVLTSEFASVDVTYEVNSQLRVSSSGSWASRGCKMLLLQPEVERVPRFHKLLNLSVDDPFL